MTNLATLAAASQAKKFTDMPVYVRLIIYAIVALILFLLIRYIVKAFKKQKDQRIIESSTATAQTPGGAISINLGTVAAEIHAALYDNDLFGWSEDEERAVVAVIGVPKSLIPQLGAVYFDLYKKNLKTELMQYLSSTQWAKISNLFV